MILQYYGEFVTIPPGAKADDEDEGEGDEGEYRGDEESPKGQKRRGRPPGG